MRTKTTALGITFPISCEIDAGSFFKDMVRRDDPHRIIMRRRFRKARDGEEICFGVLWYEHVHPYHYVQPWTVVEPDETLATTVMPKGWEP